MLIFVLSENKRIAFMNDNSKILIDVKEKEVSASVFVSGLVLKIGISWTFPSIEAAEVSLSGMIRDPLLVPVHPTLPDPNNKEAMAAAYVELMEREQFYRFAYHYLAANVDKSVDVKAFHDDWSFVGRDVEEIISFIKSGNIHYP